jgi:uncharacterized protein (DUF2236 family)
MTVTRADLERCLDRVRAQVRDSHEGLYGPGSTTWNVGREGGLMLAGGAASLMQLAHPFVAQGIADHSATREDTLGRFLRTFDNVYAMIFGTLDKAVASARRVHSIHGRVTGVIEEAACGLPAGTTYAANDQGALLWVHATLIANAVRAHELILRPLAPDERETYYEESKRFALLFGLSEEVVPADWAAFERYYEDMLASGRIAPTRAAHDMAAFLLEPPHPAIDSVWRWYAVMTAALLPPSLREGFGLRFDERERRLFESSIRALRHIYPRLPVRLRFVPAYVEAERRIAGDVTLDLFQRVAARAVRRAMRRPHVERAFGTGTQAARRTRAAG